MSLEEVEGIREEIEKFKKDIKELYDAGKFNIRESLNSIEKIIKKYNALIKKEGKEYCTEKYSDISKKINNVLDILIIEYQS